MMSRVEIKAVTGLNQLEMSVGRTPYDDNDQDMKNVYLRLF